ncbi:hypothetical protein BO70DRAFT_352705 [Aspergillus heteromorphus CBS 117.55]|uniref:Uncharacterized protein n=1 Tax=Aspergillus heteromorphus CBS 117.55 TaxID=1448321 RepID=A0A317W8L6_9EURO|nr:uncharacterized protein BO70DRAFT_352705 [Aspergillus heteromorphus CBS 117.55]PWY82071.1 hypothetical protein BO70DRAFT_352705 [Aspergillus heteromorphus CBS 117.55]
MVTYKDTYASSEDNFSDFSTECSSVDFSDRSLCNEDVWFEDPSDKESSREYYSRTDEMKSLPRARAPSEGSLSGYSCSRESFSGESCGWDSWDEDSCTGSLSGEEAANNGLESKEQQSDGSENDGAVHSEVQLPPGRLKDNIEPQELLGDEGREEVSLMTESLCDTFPLMAQYYQTYLKDTDWRRNIRIGAGLMALVVGSDFPPLGFAAACICSMAILSSPKERERLRTELKLMSEEEEEEEEWFPALESLDE